MSDIRLKIKCSCWICHWGWPKQIREIYDRALSDLDGDYMPLLFGPSHVAWQDHNWSDADIQFCINACDRLSESITAAAIARVRQSLVELQAVPIEIRKCTPEDYDGEHPENFPPPEGIKCAR